MTHEFRLETIQEDPCWPMPIQGPSMKVSVTIQGGGVNVEFHFPEGHSRLAHGAKSVLWVPFGKSPTLAELSRHVRYCVLPEDMTGLLREIAAKLGLRDSWVPKSMFREENTSSLPPSPTN